MEVFTAAVIIVLILVILSVFFVWIGSGLEHLSCPGVIKDIKVSPDTLREGKRSFKWTTENDRNYIGLDRCREGISYYGKKDSAFECGNTCKSDPYCDYWTYNKAGYEFGEDSLGECRGHNFAANNELPYTTPWPGFVSGTRYLAT